MEKMNLGEYKCHWCDYSTRGLDSIRSHLSVHLDYFPLQCSECNHWLPSELMFKFHCQLKGHSSNCRARDMRVKYKEERVDEMLSEVMGSEKQFGNEREECGSVFEQCSIGESFDLSTEDYEELKNEKENDEEGKSRPKNMRQRIKHVCSNCGRGYVIRGVVKHIWKHIADERNLTPFSCQAQGCDYITHSSSSAVYHHKTVHKRDQNAQFTDEREECGPVFEECLGEWFDLSKEDCEKILRDRFG